MEWYDIIWRKILLYLFPFAYLIHPATLFLQAEVFFLTNSCGDCVLEYYNAVFSVTVEYTYQTTPRPVLPQVTVDLYAMSLISLLSFDE